MESDNPRKKQGLNPLSLISSILILWAIITFLAFTFPKTETPDDNYLGTQIPVSRAEYSQRPLSPVKNLELKELLTIGKQDMEHNELLAKIREDLKIPKEEEISIFIGPYKGLSGEGRLVASSHPFGFFILLDETFYADLTSEEKTAVIAHELGHLINENVVLLYNLDTPILFQIEADTYATKYVRPEAVIGFLNKVLLRRRGYQPIQPQSSEILPREHKFRIENLEKIKQYRQAQ